MLVAKCPFTWFCSCHNHSSDFSLQIVWQGMYSIITLVLLLSLLNVGCPDLVPWNTPIPPGCYSRFWGYRSICVPLQYVRRDQSKARSALIPKLVCPGELLADLSLAWLTSCIGELHYREIPRHACGAAYTNMHVSLFL